MGPGSGEHDIFKFLPHTHHYIGTCHYEEHKPTIINNNTRSLNIVAGWSKYYFDSQTCKI